MKLRVMDVFSGIGGFSLGLKRAGGFETVCYVEIDPYCQAVLQARQRDGALDLAPIWDDATKFDGRPWRGLAEVVCGGFPCQDISIVGKGEGIDGVRSGLWGQMARLVREVRPLFVVVENVPALLFRGLGRVLGDLAESGYDAEWDCLPAAAFGAHHLRDRIWIVAYPRRLGGERRGELGLVADQAGAGQGQKDERERVWDAAGDSRQAVAHASRVRLEGAVQAGDGSEEGDGVFSWRAIARAGFQGRGQQWTAEPNVGRVADGVPGRVDRLSALGNSICPEVAEWLGRRIMKVHTADLKGSKE